MAERLSRTCPQQARARQPWQWSRRVLRQQSCPAPLCDVGVAYGALLVVGPEPLARQQAHWRERAVALVAHPLQLARQAGWAVRHLARPGLRDSQAEQQRWDRDKDSLQEAWDRGSQPGALVPDSQQEARDREHNLEEPHQARMPVVAVVVAGSVGPRQPRHSVAVAALRGPH